MLVYLGQTRSTELVAELAALGFGECVSRDDCLPPRRRPWFLDNGAFSDWQSGRDFDGAAFLYKLALALADPEPPDFVVCPDRVATGLESLAFSLRWRATCESRLRDLRSWLQLAAPRWYLAVQDGMRTADVAAALDGFAGIFVGGTARWKIRTARAWTRFAHERGLPVHVGRCGTADKAAWCYRIGVDSFDSSQPLWGDDPKVRFYRGLERARRCARGEDPQRTWAFDIDEEP